MKKYSPVVIVIFIMALTSCQKENTEPNAASIDGKYAFINLTVKSSSFLMDDAGAQLFSNLNYTTTDNKGTITFNNSKAAGKDLSYTINTNVTSSYHVNGTEVSSESYPLVLTLPPTNSSGTYKLHGADSISFPAGGLIQISGSSGALTSTGGGGRYHLNGNNLTLTRTSSKDSTFKEAGVTYRQNTSFVATIVMEKQ